MKRVIVHPSFMNVSFTEVQQKLASMDQGEAIFRPSSQVCTRYPYLSGRHVILSLPTKYIVDVNI